MIDAVRVQGEAAAEVDELAIERERLERVERELGRERQRLRAEVAEEVERLQAALRRASQRAADRQRELDELRSKDDRKGGRDLLPTLLGRKENESAGEPLAAAPPTDADLRAVRADELARQEAVLAEREESLGRAERMWEQVLDERSARLDAATGALEERERSAVEREEALKERLESLEDREQRLVERERELEERMRAVEAVLSARVVRPKPVVETMAEAVASHGDPVGFAEGLRSLQRRSPDEP
jgi:hypothetical protein